MPERNNTVTYPTTDMLQTPSELELILVNAASGSLPSWENLPSTIKSTRADAYANWLHYLTSHDPSKRERAAVPHVRAANLQLIYPNNPNVGTERDCDWTISKHRERFTPTSLIHSHPVNFSFSGWDADIGTLLDGWGVGDDYFLSHVSVISTPSYNYALVKTKETPIIDRWEIYYTLGRMRDQDEFMRFRRFGNKIGQSIPLMDRSYWTLFEGVEQEHFMGDFWGFYISFIDSFNASEEYNMGFYFSKKDGFYERFTLRSLTLHISSIVDNAFECSNLSSIPA